MGAGVFEAEGVEEGMKVNRELGWRELGDLPKQVGFRFLGICNDGTETMCEVRWRDRTYRACDLWTGELVHTKLKAWRQEVVFERSVT